MSHYTYAEENYPWILFLDPLPEIEYIDVFSTHFGHFETVSAAKGDFQNNTLYDMTTLLNR